jgi:serine/threonine protein kinase
MAAVYPIGEPQSDSERKAIAVLAEQLPDQYRIYHNLEITNDRGHPYEYDAIVVGRYAVYVVEIKPYGGTIKGNAHDWELQSGEIRRSPIPRTNNKARALKTRLISDRPSLEAAGIYVEATIVLTGDNAKVELRDRQAWRVLPLEEAAAKMSNPGFPVHSCRINRGLYKTIHDVITDQFRPLHRRDRVDDYRVIEIVSQNDLYTLKLAEHPMMPDNRFSLKIYTLGVHPSARLLQKERDRLLRSAHALHRLAGHPNIARAYLPFPWEHTQIVLPRAWVDGYSLRGLLEQRAEMDVSRKLDICIQVAEGLRHAHVHGVIHRDVRSENIIVPHEGPVQLVNFDCARIADLQTIAPYLKGRLDKRYAAPEIWDDPIAVSPASDQYGLGTVLFELLTGEPPCQDKLEITGASGLPHSPTELDCSLDSAFDTVVRRMCAFLPQDRYPDLQTVIEKLRSLQSVHSEGKRHV